MLLVDDDLVFRNRLGKAMRSRGFEVLEAGNVEDAYRTAESFLPDFAVVDLRMPGSTGLTLIEKLAHLKPQMKILMLTAFGSISTAVEAVKQGATNYLTKPVDADSVLAGLLGETPSIAKEGDLIPSLSEVEWEHIQRVLQEVDGNVTQAARLLGMHRRSLQRKLAKTPQ